MEWLALGMAIAADLAVIAIVLLILAGSDDIGSRHPKKCSMARLTTLSGTR